MHGFEQAYRVETPVRELFPLLLESYLSGDPVAITVVYLGEIETLEHTIMFHNMSLDSSETMLLPDDTQSSEPQTISAKADHIVMGRSGTCLYRRLEVNGEIAASRSRFGLFHGEGLQPRDLTMYTYVADDDTGPQD